MRVFLSTPIAGFANDGEYDRYRNKLLDFYDTLIQRLGRENVFAAFSGVTTLDSYESPEDSAHNDVEAINCCDLFILFYPKSIATSALVELGIALSAKKQIILVSPELRTLPYMVQGFPTIYPNQVRWFSASDTEALLNEIIATKEREHIDK